MKTCIRCKQKLGEDEFYEVKKTNSKTTYTECKICMNTRNIARLARVKILLVEYKGGQCELCGYSKNIKALEFHHLNPNEKDFSISHQRNMSMDKLKAEVDKCILICSNCHREKHDQLWRESNTINWSIYNELLKEWKLDRYYVEPKPSKVTHCICGAVVSRAGICIKCSHKEKEKIIWPSVEKLKKLLSQYSYLEVGRQLGVSDNAIRKRLKNHSH